MSAGKSRRAAASAWTGRRCSRRPCSGPWNGDRLPGSSCGPGCVRNTMRCLARRSYRPCMSSGPAVATRSERRTPGDSAHPNSKNSTSASSTSTTTFREIPISKPSFRPVSQRVTPCGSSQIGRSFRPASGCSTTRSCSSSTWHWSIRKPSRTRTSTSARCARRASGSASSGRAIGPRGASKLPESTARRGSRPMARPRATGRFRPPPRAMCGFRGRWC